MLRRPLGQAVLLAPQSGVASRQDRPRFALDALFGPAVTYAHGIPWDPWVINVDGTGLRRLAETGADEPSVAWSPDQRQLFVYSGTGSFVVEASGGEATPLAFVKGYGPVVWLASTT